MLLEISTTHSPVSDLGFLLEKHLARVHDFEIAGGKATVFYREANDARCTVALLLDIDPIGLVRGMTQVFAVLLSSILLAGCTSIFTVRIPLGNGTPPLRTDSAVIAIDDQRPASARVVHTGGGLDRCERWYGDDSYVPPKIEYLHQLLAERAPADATMDVRLQRFDTIEFCDNTANRAGAAAATGALSASGDHIYLPAQSISGGDSVLVRLAGEINGVPFDLSRRFDYEDLPYKTLTELPAANPKYRARMANAVNEIADELVGLLPDQRSYLDALSGAFIPVAAESRGEDVPTNQTPNVHDERGTSFETFVFNLGDGLAPGITPPPSQKLRVPVAYLARRGKHVSTGSVALQANYADGKFVPVSDPAAAFPIAVGITAKGYQDRNRLYNDPARGAMPSRKKGPKLPFGLHELIVPGAIPYETIYIGEDKDFGFVLANCFEYGDKRGERNCRVSIELTDYLVLNVGIPERDLAGWREYLLAARALTLPMVE